MKAVRSQKKGWNRGELIALWGTLAAIAALIPAILAIPGVSEFLHRLFEAQVPTLSNARTTFIGDAIILNWRFDKGTSNSFEVEHARDVRFRMDAKRDITDAYQIGGPFSYRVEGVRNDQRYFRVRAIDAHSSKHLSGWSAPQSIAQYDSSYRRIRATQKVLVGVSKIDKDDLFKWGPPSVPDGIDIRLMRSVVAGLSARMGGTAMLALTYERLSWPDILNAPALGSADMVVASISRGAERELNYRITFSVSYFCTSQGLIYRTGEPNQSIGEMIWDRRIGYQETSTSENLARAFLKIADGSGKKKPDLRGLKRPADVIDAVHNHTVDVGIADLPFAVEAVLTKRSYGDMSLSFRRIEDSELPPVLPGENWSDEYAIAIRRGDELVGPVNDILTELKGSGELMRMLVKTIDDYEHLKRFAPGALAHSVLRPQPWKCQP